MTVAPDDRVVVSLKDIRQALCAALAWGRVYGPLINKHDWEAMRDQQVDQHIASLNPLPEPPKP